MAKKIEYEKYMLRLEEIVRLLESGELSLEESMKLFEEGTKLTTACYDLLQKAEQKIVQFSEMTEKEEQA